MNNQMEVPKSLNSMIDVVLGREVSYRGMQYTNLQLYSRDEFNFREDIDPECLVIPKSLSSYWPGGIPELGSNFASFDLFDGGPEVGANKIQENRRKILGLELSKRAVKRWENGMPEFIRAAEDVSDVIPEVCVDRKIPFAAVLVSSVEKHRALKRGSEIAHLIFPIIVKNPRIPLKALQEAQQFTIDQEVL